MILESPVRAAVGAAGGGTIADSMTIGSETRVGRRPRGFVGLRGPQAADYLQRMVSNDVEALAVGESCDALLLTAKARVVAPLRVLRRAEDDFLLLTEPELAETVRDNLVRSRFAARVEIEIEEHASHVVLGARPEGLAARADDYGEPGWEVLDAEPDPTADTLSDAELETLRIRAATPRYGREIDDRVLPAEAGLVERAVSLTKGCYPGQEPIARLHYRGHANRSLRVLSIASTERSRGGRRASARGQGGRPRDERGAGERAPCSRSRTCAPRFPTTPCSRSGAPRPGRYTRSPRARSSGDRAQPCGG